MSSRIFDRDTLLDLTVNVIPLVILAVFILVFIVYSPGSYSPDTGTDTVAMALQFAIVGTPFVGLAVLTYYAGRAIAGDEKRLQIHAQTATYDPEAGTSIPQDEHDEAPPEAELDADETAAEGSDPELPDDES